MTLVICDACGRAAHEIHAHHVLPRSLGGIDAETNLVNVCLECHGKFHCWKFPQSKLTKLGIAEARKRGVKFGAQPGEQRKLGYRKQYPRDLVAVALDMRKSGLSTQKIADALSTASVPISQSKVVRMLRREEFTNRFGKSFPLNRKESGKRG